MKKVYIISLIVLSGVFSSMSICAPKILSENEFLTGFVTHDVLNIMAVTMTITIASIATIHIWFNELEDKHKQKVFGPARREINQSAFWLIWLFVFELVLLIIKSAINQSPTTLSLFNGAALIFFLASVFVLVDILGVMRALTPPD